MKKSSCLFISTFLVACSQQSGTVQIGENTFIHSDVVYRIIDNEITELGTLRSDSITKSRVLKPHLKNYNNYSMDFVRNGVYTELTAVYRGDVLYFNLRLNGLNDLRERYRGGALTINFVDDYGFEINSMSIAINDLVKILDVNGKTVRFDFNGKLQMSSEMYRSIFTYSVSSSLLEKGRYDW